jgi:nucleotide-binding universal stress UspA family protein
MTFSRILVAVDDSPGGLAAAQAAVELAARLPAELIAVAVSADRAPLSGGEFPRAVSTEPVLGHVALTALRAGVEIRKCQLGGEVASGILSQAQESAVDLIVVGRSRQLGYGQPYIGSQTRIVLEFASVPVLAVPPV